MTVAFSSALYYPSIDINNDRWLRNAILYWDSINTIVPVGYRDPYSSDFARDLYREGLLEPTRVSSDMEEIKGLTETIIEFLDDQASAGVLFDTDNFPNRMIHPEKLSYHLRSLLEKGLDDGGWFQLPSGFANLYMTLLATQLANRKGWGLVTESSAADQLAIAVRKGKPITSGLNDFRRYRAELGPSPP